MITNALAAAVLTIGRSVELSIVVKASLLVAVALGVTGLAGRARAAVRHVVLASTFGALVALPVAATFISPVAIEIPMAQPRPPTPSSSFGPDTTRETSRVPGAVLQRSGRLTSTSMLFRVGWAAGVGLFLAPLIPVLWRLRRARLQGLPWPRGDALVRSLAATAGINRSVDLCLHEDVLVPITCGLVRPLIVMPLDAEAWSDADLQRAVVHELEHVHRGDWPVHLLARVICGMYWFHPLVWRAWRRLCIEAERACDDAVLRGADGTAYADQLVTLARRLSTSARRPMLAMANRSDLSLRVSALLDSRQSRGRAGWRCSAMVALAAVLLLLVVSPLGAVARPTHASDASASNQTARVSVIDVSVSPPLPATPLSGLPGTSTAREPVRNAARLQEQSPTPATIDAAFVTTSVKAHASEDKRFYQMTVGPDGRFAVTNLPLRMLLRNAYQDFWVEGGPSWLDTERFDITATAEGNPSREQMWSMVRRLLVDRFDLIAHTETKVVPGYALVLARTDGTLGPRLWPSACAGTESLPARLLDQQQPPPLPCGAIRGRPSGMLDARWQTMAEVAAGLTPMLGRQVSDQTGLTGKFDLEVEWAPAPGPPGPAALGVGPATFTAIEDQLGLRLDPQPGPVDYLVIDRVDRPKEDQ